MTEPTHSADAIDPLATLAQWVREAEAAGEVAADAMALATVDTTGAPAVRMVALRGLDDRGPWFFTDGRGRKAREIATTPQVAVVFHFDRLARQIRVEGRAEPLPRAVCEAAFARRPRGAQLTASVSVQSEPIADLASLRRQRDALADRLAGNAVPYPSHWVGFCVVASRIELWWGDPDRLHRRLRCVRTGDAWSTQPLSP